MSKMSKILIVEPHPDDAALSAYSIVKNFAAMEFSLVSLFNSAPRSSEKWCEKMGIKYIDSPFAEDLLNTKSFVPYRMYKEHDDPEQMQLDYYGLDDLTSDSFIWAVLYRAMEIVNPDLILTAFGMRHKAHVYTRYLVDELGICTWYFAELPYSDRKYGEIFLNKVIKRGDYSSLDFVPNKNKVEDFVESYPTERGMLRWDRETFGVVKERLLIPKTDKEES